jgi:hypothetical protein
MVVAVFSLGALMEDIFRKQISGLHDTTRPYTYRSRRYRRCRFRLGNRSCSILPLCK